MVMSPPILPPLSLLQHSQTGVTMLMTASARGCVSAVERMLAAGADVDVRAQNSWTAKDFATCQGHEEAAKVLEEYK